MLGSGMVLPPPCIFDSRRQGTHSKRADAPKLPESTNPLAVMPAKLGGLLRNPTLQGVESGTLAASLLQAHLLSPGRAECRDARSADRPTQNPDEPISSKFSERRSPVSEFPLCPKRRRPSMSACGGCGACAIIREKSDRMPRNETCEGEPLPGNYHQQLTAAAEPARKSASLPDTNVVF